MSERESASVCVCMCVKAISQIHSCGYLVEALKVVKYVVASFTAKADKNWWQKWPWNKLSKCVNFCANKWHFWTQTHAHS